MELYSNCMRSSVLYWDLSRKLQQIPPYIPKDYIGEKINFRITSGGMAESYIQLGNCSLSVYETKDGYRREIRDGHKRIVLCDYMCWSNDELYNMRRSGDEVVCERQLVYDKDKSTVKFVNCRLQSVYYSVQVHNNRMILSDETIWLIIDTLNEEKEYRLHFKDEDAQLSTLGDWYRVLDLLLVWTCWKRSKENEDNTYGFDFTETDMSIKPVVDILVNVPYIANVNVLNDTQIQFDITNAGWAKLIELIVLSDESEVSM